MDGADVTLADFVSCVRDDRPVERGPRNGPITPYRFNEDCDSLFRELIGAFQERRLKPVGVFSIVQFDFPDFCTAPGLDRFPSWATALHRALRNPRDLTIGFGPEPQETEIPPDAWWYEGSIWEKSLLWCADEESEMRAAGLRVRRTTPLEPRYPMAFTSITCFDDIRLDRQAAEDWRVARATGPGFALKVPRNPKGAGVAPLADYGAVADYLASRIDGADDPASLKWGKFLAVYDDVVSNHWQGQQKVSMETLRQNLQRLPIWSRLTAIIPTLRRR